MKSAFYKYYMVKHIQAIDQITDLWREHCEVDLSWGVSHDVKRIEIYIKPKPNFIDIDELVEEAILKLIDEDKFVPYKYLRAVGIFLTQLRYRKPIGKLQNFRSRLLPQLCV